MTSPPPPPNNFNQRPLLYKILIPFVLIVIVFGGIGSYGTYRLFHDALTSTADQRLMAIQEVVFREIKKQEFLLLTYANLIVFQHPTNRESQSEPNYSLHQDKFLRVIGDGNITASVYPATDGDNYGVHDDIFLQVTAGGKARISFLSTPDIPACLSVVVPLSQGAKAQELLLLQTPVDRTFLKQIVAPFSIDAAILNLDRKLLVTTAEDVTLNPPGDNQLSRLLKGEKILQTVERNGNHRQLYSAIPIGNSEVVILAVDLALTDLDLLLKTFGTMSGLILLLALLVGIFIFHRLVRGITNLLAALLTATQEISSGNLGYRIEEKMVGEFQLLTENFNQMNDQVAIAYRRKAKQDQKLARLNEKNHFDQQQEEKNQEIARTNQELRIHLREISMLLQLNQLMSLGLEVSVMFDRCLNLLRDFLGSSNLVLFLYHPETDELTARKVVGAEAIKYSGASFKMSEGVTGIAAQSKELLYVPDIEKEKRYLHYKSSTRDQGSLVSSPIIANGRLVGVLNLHKPEIEDFNKVELNLIRATTNQLAIAIENSQLHEKMRTLSNTDELTNIPNRRYFHAILRREIALAQRYNSAFSIIMVDIDHFKNYNSTFGHLNGDLILTGVANILLQNTRGVDLVARFGGEEFILLLSNTNKEGAFLVAEKLRNAVAEKEFILSVNSEGEERITEKVKISLGVAVYPTDSNTVDALVEKADCALVAAKAGGRNCTVCWREGL